MTTPELPMYSGTQDAISRRAVDYFQKRRFWNWSEGDQAELDAWLAESIMHRAAYLRVEGIVAHTEALAELHHSESNPSQLTDSHIFIYRSFLVPILVAASVALIVAFGVPFVEVLLTPSDRVYSTDVGGRTLLNFADGTEIELDTDTLVRYRMTSRERTVCLEKGEAWFHVAHDPANPFTVVVGRHRVTDLGTEFLVRRDTNGLKVALLSGRATLSTEGAQTATLRPGDEAVATSMLMSITRKTPQQLADELAWQRGILVFRNTRLADAVREVNRYNTTKLMIADPAIADVKISADIKADDFEGFVRFAESVLNLHADREKGVILISGNSLRESRHRTHSKHNL